MWLPLLHTLSPSLVVVGVSAVTYRYVFSEGFFFFFFFFLTLKKKKKNSGKSPSQTNGVQLQEGGRGSSVVAELDGQMLAQTGA